MLCVVAGRHRIIGTSEKRSRQPFAISLARAGGAEENQIDCGFVSSENYRGNLSLQYLSKNTIKLK